MLLYLVLLEKVSQVASPESIFGGPVLLLSILETVSAHD